MTYAIGIDIDGNEHKFDYCIEGNYFVYLMTPIVLKSIIVHDDEDNKLSTHLYLNNNQLESLEIIGGKSIKKIYCYGNKLKYLDVSMCKYLTNLYCENNNLKELNVSNCENLINLYCQNNHLHELNISKCKKIEQICCDIELNNSLILPEKKLKSINFY